MLGEVIVGLDGTEVDALGGGAGKEHLGVVDALGARDDLYGEIGGLRGCTKGIQRKVFGEAWMGARSTPLAAAQSRSI
jgi:hypothetical protein